ncbi:conserved hypothetical protein [Perkinsus marinus ATCC 50983]|uniref:Uncharacterized protein n=1 Tax=Perkinsus marinus (strain ATCC 50983 / TXsc) TaxID=423536 RepID=C5LHN9_PERM5|nr:conserved hypothetical protein [Perkinsus marinus ATCC 50983]EER03643.1 conserved hypothetical protein [Perkinsus marinus ATCC 50983]|eukprot:XP_002771827.1 conserved hypothetical protein [Perkinsus marinus ATCC 50983]
MSIPWWIIPLLGYLAYNRFKKQPQGGATGQSMAASPAAVAFSLHLLVLVNAVLYIIPLVAYVAHIPSMVFYRMTFMGSAFVCIYTIWTNYGLPPVRSGMQAFQMWMSRVTLGADFPFLFMSLLLATGSFMPNIFGLFVIVRRSLWYCGSFANSHLTNAPVWAKIQPFWLKLKSKETEIMRVSTICELGIGFQYIINLFTPYREIMSCFLFWSLLRIRYQAPRSSAHHHEAWGIVDSKTRTLTSLPVISTVVQYGKKWFSQSLATQQAQQ